MARNWPQLPSFEQLVRLHEQGELEAYQQQINRQFLEQTPDKKGRRQQVSYLLMRIEAAQAQSSNGLSSTIKLSGMMHEKFIELNALLTASFRKS